MRAAAFFPILKATFVEWQEDKVPRLAAALAYYTVLSLAPLVILVISIAALFFGEDAARGQVFGQLQGLLGQQGAEAIEATISNADQVQGGGLASIVGIITLLLGASGVFGQLQDALNTIWGVAPKPGHSIMNFLRTRFLSFGMVLVIGFLLLVSLVLSAMLAGISTYMGSLVPNLAPLWAVINFLVSFGIITCLFAMIYRVLPDVHIEWDDVWIGSAVTALLFTVGRSLIGLYLGSVAIGSAYGAAGSLVVILVWVFYSAQILLFGAEFTQVYARRHGSRLRPTSIAVPLTEEDRARQGIPTQQYVKAIAHSETAPNPEARSPLPAPPPPPPPLKPARRSPSLLAVIAGSLMAIAQTTRRQTRRHRPPR